MDKQLLQLAVSEGLSTRKIAANFEVSQATIKHWLKKYQLKTQLSITICEEYNYKRCSQCKELKQKKEFYKKHKNKSTLSSICKDCSNQNTVKKMITTKLRMMEYKGNQCARCKLTVEESHYSVFDFHHNDPKEKDKSLVQMRSYSWEKITTELDKCSLLCANCHRLTHAELNSPLAQLVA